MFPSSTIWSWRGTCALYVIFTMFQQFSIKDGSANSFPPSHAGPEHRPPRASVVQRSTLGRLHSSVGRQQLSWGVFRHVHTHIHSHTDGPKEKRKRKKPSWLLSHGRFESARSLIPKWLSCVGCVGATAVLRRGLSGNYIIFPGHR